MVTRGGCCVAGNTDGRLSGLVMVTVSMVVVGAILLSDGRLEVKASDGRDCRPSRFISGESASGSP